MNHEQLVEQLPLYALSVLERPERQALEAHLLHGCAECYTVLKQYYGVVGLIPYGLPAVFPPAELKQRVLTKTDSEPTVSRPAPPALRRPATTQVGSSLISAILNVALVLLLAGMAYYAYTLRTGMDEQLANVQRLEMALRQETQRVETLRRQVAEQERDVGALKEDFSQRRGDTATLLNTVTARAEETELLRKELTQREQELRLVRKDALPRDEIVAVLRSPTAKVFPLIGSQRAPTAGGLLLFEPASRKALLYAFNLPPLPKGKTYQLWAFLDTPVSGAVFKIDSGNKTRLLVRDTGDWGRATGFAVSIEPQGGGPDPSGERILTTSS